jgi:hypothetical protein
VPKSSPQASMSSLRLGTACRLLAQSRHAGAMQATSVFRGRADIGQRGSDVRFLTRSGPCLNDSGAVSSSRLPQRGDASSAFEHLWP